MDSLARWEISSQDEKLPLAVFASGIHSNLYVITDLAYNLFFEKKKKKRIQQRVFFSDTGLERKQHS